MPNCLTKIHHRNWIIPADRFEQAGDLLTASWRIGLGKSVDVKVYQNRVSRHEEARHILLRISAIAFSILFLPVTLPSLVLGAGAYKLSKTRTASISPFYTNFLKWSKSEGLAGEVERNIDG